MLNDALNFLKFTLAFQSVERIIQLPGRDHLENDAEHSYQLAMFAWYLNDKYSYGLNNQKILELALVHDLVETYAGDTWVFDNAKQVDKSERETLAMKRIAKEFPDFPQLHQAILEYEQGNSPERQYIYALDKLIPILDLYLEGNGFWRKRGVTYKQLDNAKREKIRGWPQIVPLYEELMNELKQHPEYFA